MKSEWLGEVLPSAITAIGIGAVLIVFGVSVWAFHNDTDAGKTIGAIIGPTFGVIGTLVGYVSGHNAGAAGREQADARATKAQDEAGKLKGLVSGDDALLAKAKDAFPDLFW